MVKFIVTGKHETDQAHGMLGFPSFNFAGNTKVANASSTGFTVKMLIPTLPGLPVPETVPDVYSGSGLKYNDVTVGGVTLKTPYKGTIQSVVETGSNYSTEATGMGLSAEDFYNATLTRGNADNIALVKSVFSGKDLLKGGSAKDNLNGFNGADEVFGRAGNDILSGGKGSDKVFGGNGNDKINGGAGNDIQTGGKGADDFIFKGAFGKDVIKDFASKNNAEDIDLSGVSQINGYQDLKNNHMSQKGDDVLIKAGVNSIRLEDVDISDLDAQDFLF